MHLHEPLAAYLGVPPTIVLFGFAVVGLMALAGGLIACAVWMGPPKQHAA